MTAGPLDITDALGETKDLIGGKATSLATMLRLGLRVPPAFVLTTEDCRNYLATGSLEPHTIAGVKGAVERLAAATGRGFGDASDPLLLSVRSGAAISMPGMMDTILNLGLNDATMGGLTVTTSAEFADACRHRFHTQFKETVLGGTDGDIPEAPMEQLLAAISAVFRSWGNDRAKAYRSHHGIPEDLGTAVIVQAMVFGNRGATSGTGVVFSRNPNTGEPGLYGDYLADAQGEDVVAGTHATTPIAALAETMPEIAQELETAVASIEQHTKDMVDIEFTVEEGTLYFLQSRVGKRAAAAAVRIAVDLVDEGVIGEAEAVNRVSAEQRANAVQPSVASGGQTPLATGLGACPGVVTGEICLSPDSAADRADEGASVILVRTETSPADVHGMMVSNGVLTSVGGLVSHAALVARELDLPTVVGAEALDIDEAAGQVTVGDRVLGAGDIITLDGATGEIYVGEMPVLAPADDAFLERLLSWVA